MLGGFTTVNALPPVILSKNVGNFSSKEATSDKPSFLVRFFLKLSSNSCNDFEFSIMLVIS